MLVLDPGLAAIFSVGLTSYLSHIIPLPEVWRPAIAIAIVIFVAGINIIGARLSSSIIKILTGLKVGFLLFIVGFGFIGGRGDLGNLELFFAVPSNIFAAMAGGLVGAFFSFAGWWELTPPCGRDPGSGTESAASSDVWRDRA